MSLSLSVAVITPPTTSTPAPLFSGRVRVAVAPSSNVGSALLAPTALLEVALAVLPEPSGSV